MDKDFVKNRIIDIHSSKNISARALSLELGKSTEYINHVENGRINPTVEFLYDFCEYFGVTLSEFFDENYSNVIESKELLNEIKKLNKEELAQVLELVKLLNKKKEK